MSGGTEIDRLIEDLLVDTLGTGLEEDGEELTQAFGKQAAGRRYLGSPTNVETTYAARPTKRRGRRTKAEMAAIRDGLFEILAEQRPMTVRQIFYQAVSRGIVGKTEAEYKGTVCRLLTAMRREQRVPYTWIADNIRWMRKPNTHHSLAEMLEESTEFYRRALWNDQEDYVEIWLEKDALAGVIETVTAEYDVPLMVTRGYPSLSFLNTAAEHLAGSCRPSYIYYFGDRDPSGRDIPRFVEKELRSMAPDADITFELVAVTDEQVIELNLPTRPTKKTDSRAKNFEGESVEADAIPPGALRALVRRCIEQHIDFDVLERTRSIELRERQTLESIAGGLSEPNG